MEYEKEAQEVINLVLTVPEDAEDFGGRSRVQEVSSWLREFAAALSFGCTGLTIDPDGPELRPYGSQSDALASGAEVLAGASDAEVDGFLEAVRPEDHWREAREPAEPTDRDGEELARRFMP